jgi:hypothetical protein
VKVQKEFKLQTLQAEAVYKLLTLLGGLQPRQQQPRPPSCLNFMGTTQQASSTINIDGTERWIGLLTEHTF